MTAWLFCDWVVLCNIRLEILAVVFLSDFWICSSMIFGVVCCLLSRTACRLIRHDFLNRTMILVSQHQVGDDPVQELSLATLGIRTGDLNNRRCGYGREVRGVESCSVVGEKLVQDRYPDP